MRDIINTVRNIFIFGLRYPWIKRKGYVNCRLSTTFWSPRHHIVLGHRIGIGYRCVFQTDIEIGNDVMIASHCAFVNVDDHRYDIVGKTIWDSGRGDKYAIIIEDDVWIGHGSIILTPTRIGRGSIVAAGSLVTRNVPEYTIVGGVPARVIRRRFSQDKAKEHERLLSGGRNG